MAQLFYYRQKIKFFHYNENVFYYLFVSNISSITISAPELQLAEKSRNYLYALKWNKYGINNYICTQLIYYTYLHT